MDPIPSDDLIWGWVGTPNKRGTISILYSSLATIWLCTWTSLCLNLPRPHKRHRRFLLYKFRWQLFAIFFPEVLVVIAGDQWLSARQSVDTFAKMGFKDWSMTHAFFVNMGGIRIEPPDTVPFPVDASQLAYLVKHKYLAMPQITKEEIRALNKADELARFVTFVQMGYFSVQCISRGAEGIGLCPLELTTLSYILCTLHTFFFWYYKPLDPEQAKTIPMQTRISQIQSDAGVGEEYERTPLDFAAPPPDLRSLIAPWWLGVEISFTFLDKRTKEKPVQALTNRNTNPPNGLGWRMVVYSLIFQATYYAMLIGAGWTMSFPSKAESIAWATGNFVDVGLIVIYLIGLPLGNNMAGWAGRYFFNADASNIFDLFPLAPKWVLLVVHAPFFYIYILARLTVLTESLICLRALPPILYRDVNWPNVIPHV